MTSHAETRTPKRYKEHEAALYKKMPPSSVIAENIEKSFKKFGGSKYECILVAAQRMRDLQRGSLPMIATKSKAAVTALLEIEAGKVGSDYAALTTCQPTVQRKLPV